MYSCCIPCCNTISTNLADFIRFPYELERRNQWIQIIGRKNWVIDHTTLVCVQHFDKSEIFSAGDGKKSVSYVPLNSVPKNIPKTSQISQGNESCLDASMFKLQFRDKPPDIFLDILTDLDVIPSFPVLAENIRKNLKHHFSKWKIYTSSNSLVLIVLDLENVPTITTSVKISFDMIVKIYLSGIEVDAADATFILPIDSKLNRWSQLDHILNVYGS